MILACGLLALLATGVCNSYILARRRLRPASHDDRTRIWTGCATSVGSESTAPQLAAGRGGRRQGCGRRQSSARYGVVSRHSQVTSTNEAIGVGIANGVNAPTMPPRTSTVASRVNRAERQTSRLNWCFCQRSVSPGWERLAEPGGGWPLSLSALLRRRISIRRHLVRHFPAIAVDSDQQAPSEGQDQHQCKQPGHRPLPQ